MKLKAYFPESNIVRESQISREHKSQILHEHKSQISCEHKSQISREQKSQILHEHKSQISRDCKNEDREFSRRGKLYLTRRETGGYCEKIQASRVQGRAMETRMMGAY